MLDTDLHLLERHRELEALEGLVEAVAGPGEGAVALIEGLPGIGKSRLLAAAAERAAASGVRVLAGRGTELEFELAFGGVRQLFVAPLLGLDAEGQARVLDGPAALARAALGLEPAPGGAAPGLADPLHGLFWLAANLAELQPLMLAIDDLHWLDTESARFVAYLARRLEGLPLLLVGATRPAEPGASDVAAAALAAAGLVLRPAPLSADGVGRLVESAAATAAPAAEVHRLTGGNPFLVGELLRSLEAADAASPPAALGPAAVARLVLERVARVSPVAVALAQAVALFAEGAALSDAAEVAAIADVDAAAAAADALIAAGVFAPSEPLRFLHPLMRTAIYEELGPFARRRSHGRAAALLGERGAPVEHVAAHLLQSQPAGDPRTVGILRAAADGALAKRAPRAAARYLERALAEPPAQDEQWTIRHQLGRLQAMTGAPEAQVTLKAALAGSTTPQERADSALELAAVAYGHLDSDEAVGVLLSVRGETELDVERRLLVDGVLAAAAWDSTQHAHVYRQVADALPRDLPGDTPGERLALTQRALRMFDECEPHAAVLELAVRAIGDEPPPMAASGGDLADPLNLLMACGSLDAAAAVCEERAVHARETGRETLYVATQTGLGRIAFLRGDLTEAEAIYRLALEQPGALPVDRTMLGCGLATVLLERGRIDEAEAALAALPSGRSGAPPASVEFRRAQIALARGDAESALAVYRDAYAALTQRGSVNPAESTWLRDMAEALAQEGRRDEAIDLMRGFLARAERFGEPRPLGIAHITLGRLLDGGDAMTHFERARTVLARSPHRLIGAQAELELGAALRRANARSEARELLSAALDTAQRAGASPLADRALDELRSTGARPRRRLRTGVDALTPSEARIARLAAEGMSNREIAQHLFLTVKTVEMHLVRAFRKLDVSSRRDLPAVLGAATAA